MIPASGVLFTASCESPVWLTLCITCGPCWRGPGQAVVNAASLRRSIPRLICQRCTRSFAAATSSQPLASETP